MLPDESKVIMSSLRQFSGTQPLYALANDGTLTNNQSGVKYRPNDNIGFYQSINADGSWGNEKLSPGYTVTIGWDNFTRVFPGRRDPETVLRHFRLDRGVLGADGDF